MLGRDPGCEEGNDYEDENQDAADWRQEVVAGGAPAGKGGWVPAISLQARRRTMMHGAMNIRTGGYRSPAHPTRFIGITTRQA